MAHERQAILDQEAAQAAKIRQADVAGWVKELAELAPSYVAVREHALSSLADLALTTERLQELRTRANELRSYIMKVTKEAPDTYPAPLADRKAFLAARAVIIGLLGPSL
jgi:recombinational DNA repair ATPase RecF